MSERGHTTLSTLERLGYHLTESEQSIVRLAVEIECLDAEIKVLESHRSDLKEMASVGEQNV